MKTNPFAPPIACVPTSGRAIGRHHPGLAASPVAARILMVAGRAILLADFLVLRGETRLVNNPSGTVAFGRLASCFRPDEDIRPTVRMAPVARQICARPPSTATSLAVMKLLSSDARKAATVPISAGSAMR